MRINLKLKLSVAALAAIGLSGCMTAPLGDQGEQEMDRSRDQLRSMISQAQRASENSSGFYLDDSPAILVKPMSVEAQKASSKSWLTQNRITLDTVRGKGIPAPELIRMLRTQYGLNINSTLPLDSYTYNGFGVTNVDAETALQILLGTMGLDFELDNQRKVVSVQPMKPRTWTLNLGNRRTNFSSGTPQAAASTASAAPGAPYGMPAMAQGTSTTGTSTGTSAASTMNAQSSSTTGIAVTDDFWNSLNREIKQRLTILVPKAPAAPGQAAGGAPMPTPMPQNAQYPQVGGVGQQIGGSASGNTDLYVPQAVGSFSINPETGAIWVQAPAYIQKDIDDYLTEVQEMYNTSITFEGKIVTVTSTKNISEGIDWAAFNTLANGDFTSVIQNNVLGGAVISSALGTTNAVNSVSFGNAALPGAGSALGIMSATKQFALFNAFLSTIGQVKVVDSPLVRTTSGIPVLFEKKQLSYYTRYSQNAASGGVGAAAVATVNEDVPYYTGVTLRMVPRYDSQTGLVRAQFSLSRTILTGWDDKVNVLTSGGTFQNIPSRTPKLSDSGNDGEVILKDGDMIVVGGMTEDSEDNTDRGVTGLMDSPIRALAGSTARNKVSTTYYFAIRVTVKRKQ